ncbi:hypothetical protein HN51_004464 [Arachis hypogaea]|uniref:Uncharacterized protein LOC107483654 n=1 Tax=Arachis duranensis TaxID=130453 RepID=A0A6P4D5R7_ARADU|nr:uncharacterized protein LOC107483654 [Arachis duranensis]XP_025694698.1 uncharacterized protein LOC112796456 [Arachis hypogaea]QHO38030.1 uncharacterized protein DS421_4g116790 [Arachis hypogaea]QHO38031.1 uncharacterized protein DS421_4g116790 [Arachis hypogaea]QHO38032.1 uncharacterized protein DS421_4g116790 [Arachis hypogaea]
MSRFLILPKHFASINPWPWLSLSLFSTRSSSSRSKGKSFTVSYLVGTCGFSPERAVSVSKRFSFKTSERPDTVIAFFRNIGLSQTSLFRVLQSMPQLLVASPERSLQPKIDFFKSKGFSTSDICKTIVNNPLILIRSVQVQIAPAFDFFDDMFPSRDKLIKAIIRNSSILYDFKIYVEPNIKLLREAGVPISHVIRLIEYCPRQLKANPKRFKEVLQEIKEMKFDPFKFQFVVAIYVNVTVGKSSLARRKGIYRKWGWTDGNIFAAFRNHPWCLVISDDKIEAIMDYLVNELGYSASSISSNPWVLSMSLKRRIIPRGSVILVLQSKGLGRKLGLGTIFRCNEEIFLNKFIFRHEKEADDLLKLYQANLGKEQVHKRKECND